MLGLDVRGDPAVDEYTDPAAMDELAELAQRFQGSVPGLHAPLLIAWSDEPVLALDRGEPWLYCPVERDPSGRDGRSVLPRAQRRRLEGLSRPMPPVHRVAIAHQLDPSGNVGELLPVLRHSSRTCTDGVARAVVGPVPPHPAVRRSLRGLDRLRRGAAVAADVVLDPILFGVVGRNPPVHGDVCLWFPLVAWTW